MSCGQPGPEDEDGPQLAPATALAEKCIKCSQPAVIVVRTTSWCLEHFRDHLQFMFREGMNGARTRSKNGAAGDVEQGKKRGLQRSKIVVAFSGGTSSRVLLDLLRQYFPTETQLKARNPKNKAPAMFESLEVVYVDESGVPGFGPDRTNDVRRIVEATQFPLTVVKLEDVFTSGSGALSASLATPSLPSTSRSFVASPRDQLLAMLSPDLHTPTSLAALHTALLHSLLRSTATSLGADILLLGSSATRLAIRTLSSMAEGGGWAMGEDVGVDYTSSTVTAEGDERPLLVARPLGRLLFKELAFVARVEKLEYLTMVRPSTMVGEAKKAGIAALVEEFVLGLEDNFPSTVSTIIRTAQKLGMRSEDAYERKSVTASCPLCGLPAQEGADEWRKAITIDSLEDARRLRAATVNGTESIHHKSTLPEELSSNSDELSLAPLLCYSCLLVLQGTKTPSAAHKAAISNGADANGEQADKVVPLPPYVARAARRRLEAGALRLPDSDEVLEVRQKSVEESQSSIKDYLL